MVDIARYHYRSIQDTLCFLPDHHSSKSRLERCPDRHKSIRTTWPLLAACPLIPRQGSVWRLAVEMMLPLLDGRALPGQMSQGKADLVEARGSSKTASAISFHCLKRDRRTCPVQGSIPRLCPLFHPDDTEIDDSK